MKNKIIKKSLFILLVSVLMLPLISSEIFADSEIHLPTLEPFNWPIVSLHGPRYMTNSRFHAGIDFSPLPGDEDLGYMIHSRTNGEIIQFVKGSSGGWRLVVRPPSDIRSLHGANDFFYMHLFQNDGTVPGIQNSEDGYTKVVVVDVTKSVEVDGRASILKCKGIAFWKNSTLAKVLTKTDCHGGTYGTHSDVPATSKVGVFEEIAPIGNSHNSTIKAHLHFGMNFGTGSSERDNPFYALKRTDSVPGMPFFKAKLMVKNFDLSKLPPNPGFWVEIDSDKELSLDKIDLWLMKDWGKQFVGLFSFGGRPGESRVNTDIGQIEVIGADPNCTNTPLTTALYPITQACDWSGTPDQRKWRFFVPFTKNDITYLTSSGENKLCVGMASINGHYSEECTNFTVTKCDNLTRGALCFGGMVVKVEWNRTLIASLEDQGDDTWFNAVNIGNKFKTLQDGISLCTGAADEICYDDWFLPDLAQLEILDHSPLMNFTKWIYWSSMSARSDAAWTYWTFYGKSYMRYKDEIFGIRPVRYYQHY